MSSENSAHVPVLIIGGGIVGLSASLFLSHYGIASVLIERRSGTSIHPRARSVNARTMEIYRSIGIADAVREAGALLGPSMGIYAGSSLREVIEAKPRGKEGEKRAFPFADVLSETGPERGAWGTQDCVEPVLLRVARERGADVRFSTECLGVEDGEEKVTATLRSRDGRSSTYTVTADYLIAADGANSPIRTQLRVGQTGQGELGNLLNILFHAPLKPLVQNREFSLCRISRPEVSGLFTSINNDDRWVFHLLYDPSKGESPSDFPPERCVGLLHEALGMGSDLQIEVKSILPWQASVRIAERFRVGRVFLAGDAAHQMPPWAGQGANSGVGDAHNLCWKLAAVLKHRASPVLLESYEVERLPVGRKAAEVSGSAADERGLISVKWDVKTALSVAGRIHLMSGFGYTYISEAIIEESTWPLGGASWRPWTLPSLLLSLDGRPGSRTPHVWVEKGEKRISTIDLLGKGFVLLAGSEGGSWCQVAEHVASRLGVDIKAYTTGPQGDLTDPKSSFQAAAGISATGALVARPDGFVAWRERRLPADPEDRLEKCMRQILCL